LFSLDLSNNQLQELPVSMVNLKNLHQFYLWNNPLEIPPYEIARKGISVIQDYFNSQGSSTISTQPNVFKYTITSNDLIGNWAILFSNIYNQERGTVYTFNSSNSFYNGQLNPYEPSGSSFIKQTPTDITWELNSDGKTISLLQWTESKQYYIDVVWTIQSLNETTGELTVNQELTNLGSSSTLILSKCGTSSTNTGNLNQICF
jgi:hypothetical protein